MIVGLFSGINQFGRTISFGAAVLLDETSDTISAVFQSFLRCMNNVSPVMLITDEDPAILLAASALDTKHFICHWHLFRNVNKNLKPVLREFSPRCQLNIQ
jgi:zinc finger SWIM domain-containing protein 3